MANNKLTCKELVELVTDYLEDRLPVAERARFEVHLTSCQGCRNYLEQMGQTLRLLGELTEDSLEPETQQELLEVFRNWKKKSD